MKPDEIEEALQALHREAGAAPPDHRERLEARLLARFDELNAHQENRPMFGFRFPLRPVAVAAVVFLGLGLASQAPADYSVEVGKSVEITFPDGSTPHPSVQDLVDTLKTPSDDLKVEAEVRKAPGGVVSMKLSLWGETVALTDIETTLRQKFPSLTGAQISVGTVQGTIHSSLGGVIAHGLFASATSPAEIEAARQALIQQLRDAGEDGNVDVQVEDEGNGQRRVKVRVEKTETEPQ
jgi:hypothetical protein